MIMGVTTDNISSINLDGSHPFLKRLLGWRSRKVGELKINGRMEKWEDKKYLVFPHVCVFGWRDGKMEG